MPRVRVCLVAALLQRAVVLAQDEQPRVKLVVKSDNVPNWEIPVFTVLAILAIMCTFAFFYYEKIEKHRALSQRETATLHA